VNIRKASPTDARAIAEVHVASRRAGYAAFFPAEYLAGLTIADSEAMWQERLEDPLRVAAVIEADGRVAGYTWYGKADMPIPHELTGGVEQLYVDPDHWRRGFGSALIREAEEGLVVLGFSDAVLSVYEANEQARRFYEARGWSFDGASWKADRAASC
jgi:ribosomal protein S18 acetylase RimI-like enzyme